MDVRYARNGDISLAYAVLGEGPTDLLVVPGFVSHLEYIWQAPGFADFSQRLLSFCRVISFDRRGTGLSDRATGPATVEDHARDARAVLDAAGVDCAALLGISEGASVALLCAAMFPERVSSLVVWGGWARIAWAPDYEIGFPVEALEYSRDVMTDRWATGFGLGAWAPSLRDDPAARDWWAHFKRLAASPSDIRATYDAYTRLDVRHVLPTISAPTLVLHRKGDRVTPIPFGRYIADRIPGARMVELEGTDHWIWTDDPEPVLAEIQEFLTGTRGRVEPTRRLATVLFSDIVGSTQRAAELGDSAWRSVLARHDSLVRRALERFGGREVKTTGDGFLATFEGPTSAIRCASAVRDGVGALGLRVRLGLHTGEVEVSDGDIGGIGVHIARRVADLAAPDEVWVSATVPGLVTGSGTRFEDRGTHDLRGVPGVWPLFSVQPG